jgi:hypothetical protein
MAARAFFIPGVFILFCAFILSLLVAISLPGLPDLDIARVHFTSGTAPHVDTNTESIREIRVCNFFSSAFSILLYSFFF